jgi:hypothetical protein
MSLRCDLKAPGLGALCLIAKAFDEAASHHKSQKKMHTSP